MFPVLNILRKEWCRKNAEIKERQEKYGAIPALSELDTLQYIVFHYSFTFHLSKISRKA